MSGKTDIRMEITQRRIRDIEEKGPAGGLGIPGERSLPLVPFLGSSPVICEIKRCSPSKKNIDLGLDPLETAARYRAAGVKNVSILTEENYFNGSLADLAAVKGKYPDLAVLRKDFLVDVRDVEISHRFGADAVLLIASLLSGEDLAAMHKKALELGMTPLVEIHDEADALKAAEVAPRLVGINSRNLKTFRIDPLQPLRIRSLITWETRVIYESGVLTREDGEFVAGTGFDGVLVGEAAVKQPDFPNVLLDCFRRKEEAAGKYGFWKKLYAGFSPRKPLIKICGLTKIEDYNLVAELGADMAGFILAESPRRTVREFIESCAREAEKAAGKADSVTRAPLRVGVVVLKSGEALPQEIKEMVKEGILDAVQFHGSETPEQLKNIPGYKAFRLREASDIEHMASYPSRARLIDAFSAAAAGGTGKRIEPELVRAAAERVPLWLAGGLNPENIKSVLKEFRPDLIDLSSGLELSPGIKDPDKLKALFDKAASYE